MWSDVARLGWRAVAVRIGATLVLTAGLASLAYDAADARRSKSDNNSGSTASTVAPPPNPALLGTPIDPTWPKHVYVMTDSVMLGAKSQFIKGMAGWEVTFDGRPALMIRKAIDEVRARGELGPVAVIALGYNSIWQKNRQNFQRWSDRFDSSVEDMLALLKEKGVRRVVWVTLRELSSDLVSGRTAQMQYQKYSWYFPYVNERLRAIKARHPEMSLADWSSAAHQSGVTYDAIHLNPRGAELMVNVVKAALGVDGRPPRSAGPAVATMQEGAPRPTVASISSREPIPSAGAIISTEPRRTVQERSLHAGPQTSGQSQGDGQTQPAGETQPSVPTQPNGPTQPSGQTQPGGQGPSNGQPKKPSYRSMRLGMFALSQIDFASVVMLGDSLTERAQWAEITGCRFVANRGIGGDDSGGVLRRLDDVVRLKPGAVFLMIGVNDVLSSVPTETIIDNVQQIVARLTQSGAQVYLTLVLPVAESVKRKVNPQVDELNTAYIKLAEQNKISLVDFRAKSHTERGFLRDELSLDGIHLTPQGYRIWRDAVTPLVLQHCSGKPVADPRATSTIRGAAPTPPSGTSNNRLGASN